MVAEAAKEVAAKTGNMITGAVKGLLSWKGLGLATLFVGACALTPAGSAALSQVFATAAAPGASTGFVASLKTAGSASWAAVSNGAGPLGGEVVDLVSSAGKTAIAAVKGASTAATTTTVASTATGAGAVAPAVFTP